MWRTALIPAVLAAGIGCAPTAVADPPMAHEFHGMMIGPPNSTTQVHAELVDDPSGNFSTMTAGSCVQRWHITETMPSSGSPGVRRSFVASDVVSGQSNWCKPCSNIGINLAEPNTPYSMKNGHWNLTAEDQVSSDVSWVMDSDVSV
jgi:hypothetical protein